MSRPDSRGEVDAVRARRVTVYGLVGRGDRGTVDGMVVEQLWCRCCQIRRDCREPGEERVAWSRMDGLLSWDVVCTCPTQAVGGVELYMQYMIRV